MLRSVLQHLRLPFSFLLMPVFMLALASVDALDTGRALTAFLLIHLLLYPSSNGYNGLQDQDTGPVGGISAPLPAHRVLGWVTLVMDAAGLLLALLVSPLFGGLYLVYVVFSRLYSYRGIRLKKHPVWGYLTVSLAQGALIYGMAWHAADAQHRFTAPWPGALVSTLLIGAFYPVTQIYQHAQDRADGVITLSAKLGIRGTFVYCAALYGAAFGVLGFWFYSLGRIREFFLLLVLFTPVLVWFLSWMQRCFADPATASHKETMRMAWRAAVCTNLAFSIIFLLHQRFG